MADTASVPPPDFAPLPPFSGDDTVCVMCSHPEAFTVFRPSVARLLVEEYNGRTERRGPLPARLERQCQRCDYQWDEALNPSLGPRPATLDDIALALQHAHQGWALDLSPECAEHMAEALLRMFHLHVRPDHLLWAQGPPLLLIPADVAEAARQQLDPHLTAQVPIAVPPPAPAPGQPKAVLNGGGEPCFFPAAPTPLQDRHQPESTS
ncbi:hypothetical protein GCM10010387_16170 [Streptomyces inusitatus]|uniref:Uncharacterized protein n=1 Tax=Streptomyces inusitatus TaxID=68221 RepID=A0A918UNY7_9ACTN|nr:hypothetical protein [Streptomyces inusitatus]GGZ23722.1 hypothetical protein GCM10010387_16170 [Streptomyces inusitatus]